MTSDVLDGDQTAQFKRLLTTSALKTMLVHQRFSVFDAGTLASP